jgi:hypothetical protein
MKQPIKTSSSDGDRRLSRGNEGGDARLKRATRFFDQRVRRTGDDEGSRPGRLPEPRPFCGGVSFGDGLHAPSIPGPVPVAPRPAAESLGGPQAVLGRDRVGCRARRPSAPDAPFPATLDSLPENHQGELQVLHEMSSRSTTVLCMITEQRARLNNGSAVTLKECRLAAVQRRTTVHPGWWSTVGSAENRKGTLIAKSAQGCRAIVYCAPRFPVFTLVPDGMIMRARVIEALALA